jgi:hypothetical protein
MFLNRVRLNTGWLNQILGALTAPIGRLVTIPARSYGAVPLARQFVALVPSRIDLVVPSERVLSLTVPARNYFIEPKESQYD